MTRASSRPTIASMIALAAALALPAGPAAAQVRQGDPNAANRSLSSAGQSRASGQNLTTQGDTTMMNAERARTAAPPPPAGTGPRVTVPVR